MMMALLFCAIIIFNILTLKIINPKGMEGNSTGRSVTKPCEIQYLYIKGLKARKVIKF